jgi:NTE family protein
METVAQPIADPLNPAVDREAGSRARPRLAVVLSSGGIKPLAAVPLFELLDQAQVTIDLLAGCSGGSIVCAARGAGYSVAEMLEFIRSVATRGLFSKLDLRTLLGVAGLPFGKFTVGSGLIRPARLKAMFREMFGDRRIEDLRPKTLIQATDITTGEGVILERGYLADAVYASCALFPLLPPIEIDGRWLADGAYTSSLPVIEAVKRNMDVVVAEIFHNPINLQAKSYMECLSNYSTIQGDAITRFQLALSINLDKHEIFMIKVPFKNPINMWNVGCIPEIIENGRQALVGHQDEILAAIGAR